VKSAWSIPYTLMKGGPAKSSPNIPNGKNLWYDDPDASVRTSRSFYQQLASLNLGAAWQRVKEPVLEFAEPETHHERLTPRISHASSTRFIPATPANPERRQTHGFTVNDKFATLIPTILELAAGTDSKHGNNRSFPGFL